MRHLELQLFRIIGRTLYLPIMEVPRLNIILSIRLLRAVQVPFEKGFVLNIPSKIYCGLKRIKFYVFLCIRIHHRGAIHGIRCHLFFSVFTCFIVALMHHCAKEIAEDSNTFTKFVLRLAKNRLIKLEICSRLIF